MKLWIGQLDQLLRGEKTKPQSLQGSKLNIHPLGIAMVVGLLAVSYGLCMGSFALARGLEAGDSASIREGAMQTFASMAKMPLLYASTLCITFPSLYVFSALVGSRLQIGQVLKLLISALAVNLAVLASLGPIVAFFSVSTPSYNFVLLLNVLCCALAGMLGLVFLLQTLYRMTDPAQAMVVEASIETSEVSQTAGDAGARFEAAKAVPPGPLKRTPQHILGRHVRKVFWIWIFVFGLVGTQMGWVLRPFIGSPSKPFTWFRARESNVFEAILGAFQGLFG